MLLRISNLTKKFVGITAVDHLSFEIGDNEILGIIGPNGSGKTTTLNCINGIYRVDEGEILFKGNAIQGARPHEIARMGIGRTFQVPKIFKKISVFENMLSPVLNSNESDNILKNRASALLEMVGLSNLKDHLGEELSGGQQKILELARILMFDPILILLDEPFAGVHPLLRMKFHEMIISLHEKNKSFILVSHDLPSLYLLSSRIIVLNNGMKIAEGSPKEIQRNEAVIEAYLGR
ncbi:MAG: ABC transporter ATP-binding protein [Thermodesulfobacteriota bacterium]